MSPELLRSQVLRYKALVEEDTLAVGEFYDKFAPVGTPFTPKTAKAISNALLKDPEMNETIEHFTENLSKYWLFYDKLKEKGGDPSGLELNIGYDYNRYISPPIQETPDPLLESRIKEAA